MINNLAGHKLPTAYPSRRVWLHVTVGTRAAKRCSSRARLNHDGSIRGNDNDARSSRYEAHHESIDHPEQVQIYEAIMGDPDGKVTTGLLRRSPTSRTTGCCPMASTRTTAKEAVAVVAVRCRRTDFVAGHDRVGYGVDISGAEGPCRRTGLMYQPIGYRWAINLGDQKAEEIERFIGYYEEMAGSSSVILAGAKAIAE